MSNVNDLKWYFSGGAGNNEGQLSLGGGLGEPILNYNFTLFSANSISGVSIVKGFGFPDNELVTIDYDSLNDAVLITSDTFYAQKTVTTDGVYVFESGNSYLILNITYAQMSQATITNAKYTAELIHQNVYDDVLPLEATDGRIDFRVLYLYNEGGTDATNLTFHVQQPAGADTIRIKEGSVNTEITAASSETDSPLPDGTFYEYTTEYSNGINVGTLQAGQFIPIVLERYIPSNIQEKVENQLIIVVAAD